MTASGYLQLGVYLLALLLIVKPLGAFMARVYQGEPTLAARALRPFERLLYRLLGTGPDEEMDWKTYARSFLVFNILGLLVVFGLQRLQGILPLGPENRGAVAPDLAFNTAASFATNTNWQSYAGEVTLGYFVQMLGLTVQNFVSAASGMAVLVALARGLVGRTTKSLGNFWVDLVRGTLYILLPLSFVLAVLLVSQGVVQTFSQHQTAALVQPTHDAQGRLVAQQVIAVGPAASQIAIKQLGTNGGGFFGVNSAHPFENPTPLSNFMEVLAILLIPAALTYTFGRMVKDQRQGWALLAAMTFLFVAVLALNVWAEQSGNPRLAPLGVTQVATASQSGGNMEGKEVRFGIAHTALFANTTTSASCGAVDGSMSSLTPIAGGMAMLNIALGEIVFGGVGSGLYGILVFALIAVFIAGLMVGRTPEYLGKKIGPKEIKMAMFAILALEAGILVMAGVGASLPAGLAARMTQGPHGLSEILYAFTSGVGNNGSALAGLGVAAPFLTVAVGIAMLVGRYLFIVPMLAIAGSLAAKKHSPPSAGTFPTNGPLFTGLLVGVIAIVGALTFFPVYALGPILEHFLMHGGVLF